MQRQVSRGGAIATKDTGLDGTLLEDHATGGHDLLVGAGDVEIPAAGVVGEEVGDMATMEGHGHHGKFLDGVCVGI